MILSSEQGIKMIRILVLGVGGNVSQGIVKALRKTGLDIHITGACVSPVSAGLYMCDEAYLSPYAKEERFMSWLVEICNRQKIDMILTGVEENIREIVRQKQYLESCAGAVFAASSYEQLKIGQDKLLTARWLKENGRHYPAWCDAGDTGGIEELVRKAGFPLLAKPRRGKGSHGIYVLHDEKELKRLGRLENYVLEEYVGSSDHEYTVGCYCSKNGALMDVIIMRRRLKNGTTVWAEVVENEAIRREAEKICKAFGPKGPLNLQMRLNGEGEAVCFEMNVRFSGTTAMRANFGFCDVEAMVREYILGEPIENCFHVVPGEAYRYDEELYLPPGTTGRMEGNI